MAVGLCEEPAKNVLPMKFSADNLSILLSSDWFINAWNLCGLHSGETVRSHVQKGCRSIVESITDGCATYWESEFSESRGLHTRTELIAVFQRSGIAYEDRAVCERYLDGVDEPPELSGNLTLVETLCSLFVSEHGRGEGTPGQFGVQAIACIEAALDEMSSERMLVVAGSHAGTKWDQWLRQLTPDLPTFTVDTARDLARHAGSHAKLFGQIRSGLTADELCQFGSWLCKSAAELADVTLSPTVLTPN
jgi:hypothetical protein